MPHPILRAVLDNLDVQLEEELIRYRRQQRLHLDSSKRRQPSVQPYAFDGKIPARPTRDGIQLPNVRDTFNLETTGELPIGNSAESENPVKTILGGTVAGGTGHVSIPQPLPWPSGALQPPPMHPFPYPPLSSLSRMTELPMYPGLQPTVLGWSSMPFGYGHDLTKMFYI
ncbi:MAG: hypothetical protein HC772_19810 [Leptolyngbyaceae cyanobacterium CRU_2_3]|nr:hypothetical protein [Leptolyngbyaceae cyanobacterium CRU_2_3]